MRVRRAFATLSLLLVLALVGCRPEADSDSPDPSSAGTPSLLVLGVSVWNDGAVVRLPVADAARVSGHLGAVPPLAFAIDGGPLPVVAVIQTLFEEADAGWEWQMEVHRYDAERFDTTVDTFAVGLSRTLARVTFRASPDAPLVHIGAPAAAGPVVVVRQHNGRWRTYAGPDAFDESGVTQVFEAQVRDHLTPAAPRDRPPLERISEPGGVASPRRL